MPLAVWASAETNMGIGIGDYINQHDQSSMCLTAVYSMPSIPASHLGLGFSRFKAR